MRIWQSWWRALVFSSQYSPPRFIELIMLTVATVLIMAWEINQQWPYLVLGLSYMVGAAGSILVREALTPSHHPRVSQVMAVLMLIVSFYCFADLTQHL
ncbi:MULTISPECIES: hypothetical protein [Cyanophyceae]|uniref:hypothetical protein n=1 Tax=Cyanophyceae TaxID=3028117 RepID=UPI0016841306|nr:MULTISPECIES: hypothetical protein [unclassified Trichocoleus]MBD1834149.1 hypothetical protein [Cyanobacteria bacterium FACHB-472]MBD1930639.1 hypothetical protein [Trichocoleus sp. FACHB-69]MBD2006077.1 hypothetical protein [Trichocoleus sp. FACHB-40]